MKMKTLFTLLLLIFTSYSFSAQQVVKKDTLNGTPLTVSMDASIAKLMNGLEENCSGTNNANNNAANLNNPNKVIKVPSRALTNEEICRQNPRISGYKIQVIVAKSNDEANKIRSEFRSKFPNLKVEIDASLRPNYKVLAGSYFTKASAASDLKNIRKEFSTAVPIQYRIFCAEAK